MTFIKFAKKDWFAINFKHNNLAVNRLKILCKNIEIWDIKRKKKNVILNKKYFLYKFPILDIHNSLNFIT